VATELTARGNYGRRRRWWRGSRYQVTLSSRCHLHCSQPRRRCVKIVAADHPWLLPCCWAATWLPDDDKKLCVATLLRCRSCFPLSTCDQALCFVYPVCATRFVMQHHFPHRCYLVWQDYLSVVLLPRPVACVLLFIYRFFARNVWRRARRIWSEQVGRVQRIAIVHS